MVDDKFGKKKTTRKGHKKFHRPNKDKIERKRKYMKKLENSSTKKNYLKIFKYPLTTESSMKKIQSSNTIILIFDPTANKGKIKFLMEKIYKTKVTSVNTLITPYGFKKAFIKLSPDQDALDVANKIGFI